MMNRGSSVSLNDWKLVNSQTISRHPVFCLRNDRYRLEPDTAEKEFVVLLGSVWPNPAIQDNRCHCFLASPVRKVAEPEPDLWERIDVVLVPLKAIPDMIRNGSIQHSLVLVSFALMGVVGSSKT